MYSLYVVFIEVGGKSDPEEVFQIENNPDTMWFELRNEEYDLDESAESEEEVEQQTSMVRRSERTRKPL